MDEILRTAVRYLRQMWAYRWIGLLVTWVVAIVGGVVVFKMPDKYEASARLFVDTQSLLRPLMSGLAVQPNLDQQVVMLSKTLISRPNMEKILRMADLDLAAIDKKTKDELIEDLLKNVKLSGGRDNLYTVAYAHRDRASAQKVVQSIVTLFVESGLGGKRQNVDSAKKFIEEQIKSYEAKLFESEQRLKEFRIKNLDRKGISAGSFFSQAEDLQTKIRQAKLDLREAVNSRDAIKKQVELAANRGAAKVPAGNEPESEVPSNIPTSVDGRLYELNSQLDDLLRRYTEQHPDVKALQKRIAELVKVQKEEIHQNRLRAPGSGAEGSSSSQRSIDDILSQQLALALAEAEASVASMSARVSEYEERFKEVRDAAKLAPEIDAEFAQLNRDYEIQRSNYSQLVERREAANMSEEMDASGVAEFRLIEPPRVGSKPSSPDRILLLPLVLLASLAGGLVTTFMASQMRPVFHDGRALADASGLPVLGTVSMLLNANRRKYERRRTAVFFGGVGTLFAAYGALIAFVALISRTT